MSSNANGAANGHAPRATSRSRSKGSWLDGTMEIISDVRRTARSPSPAPRPRRAGMATPPASPRPTAAGMRSFSPVPLRRRLPSQDAMDLSVHNDLDSSQHGTTSGSGPASSDGDDLDNSIHGLRSANSTLTSKMADLEADYLNQITALSNQIKTLNEKCRLKDQQLEALESSAAAADKATEQVEMSKQTIQDLKNQLYSLQDQLEDSEFDKQGEIERLQTEGAERERQLREDIKTLEAEVDELKTTSAATAVGENGGATSNGTVGRHVADSDIEAYEAEITMLKEQLSEAKPVWGQIDAIRKEKDREIGELRSMLRARDDTIASLQSKNADVTDELTSIEAELDRSRTDGEGREEELTELRETIGERDAELQRTKEEMAQLRDTVGERDAELQKIKKELEEQTSLAVQLTQEITDLKEVNEALESAGTEPDSEVAEKIANLEAQLKDKVETIVRLEEEATEHKKQIAEVQEDRDATEKELIQVRNTALAREAESTDTTDIDLLRKEVDDVTRERMALEGELKKKLAEVKKEHMQNLTKLEVELSSKEEEVDTLTAQLVEKTNALESAHAARAALDNEKKAFLKVGADSDAMEQELQAKDAELKRAQEDLGDREREFQLTKTAMETSLKDREAELKTARAKITALEISVEELENGVIRPKQRGVADAPDDEGGSAVSRIKAIQAERDAMESELKSKLEDRDTTISTLVKSSTRAEHNLNQMKAEISSLREQLEQGGANIEVSRAGISSEVNVESLHEALNNYRMVEDQLSKEISRLKHELNESEAEVTRLRSDSPDLARIEELHREQIAERDAAISKLVKSSVSLEEHISSLQEEVEMLRHSKGGRKSTDGPSWEELHRLQQESEIFAGQIIEQDEEIEGLRNELDEQREINDSLARQISDLKSNRGVTRGGFGNSKLADLQAHLDEVQEANQAHRQELRDLRKKLRETQLEADRVADLEVQLREARSSRGRAVASSAFQGDEIEEFEMREELESLRRSRAALEKELREAKAKSATPIQAANRPSQAEQELRQDLEEALATKEASEERFSKQMESLRKLKDSAKLEFEEQIRERDGEITLLKGSIAEQEGIVASLQKEIDGYKSAIDKEQDEAVASLRNEINTLKSNLGDKASFIGKLEKEITELKAKLEEQTIIAEKERRNAEAEFGENVKIANMDKDALVKKIFELEGELKSLESDYSNIRDLRKRLKIAEEDRTKVEQKVAAAFDKKILLLQTEKDAEIDRLRKDLTVSKERLIELETDCSTLQRQLDSSNIEIQEELEERLHQKNARIMALEQTLSAQEQVLGNMQAEMDQLQSGMDKVSLTRRAEIEEMEQELMESAQAVTKYEREIAVLKDKLEDSRLKHSGEVDKLKQRVAQLESETPYERSVREQQDDRKVQELNEKIDQLKWRLSEMQEENKKLRDKLEQQHSASSKRAPNSSERYRTAALQEQVHKLSQKNKDLEKEIQVTTSTLSTPKNFVATPKTPRSIGDDDLFTSTLSNTDLAMSESPEVPSSTAAINGNETKPPAKARSFGKSARDKSNPSKFSLKKHFRTTGGSRSRANGAIDDQTTHTEETF